MKKKIVIIGYGIVGHNVSKIFPDADIHDPVKQRFADGKRYDFGIICVPTEMAPDGSCNTSVVRKVIELWGGVCETLILRSTVPPGFTEQYQNIVFQPEYYGATQHANDNNYDFIILGGEEEPRNKAAELYKEIHTGNLRINKTDSTTAEIVKYMENSWLATKVTFCNEFYRIAEAFGRDYDQVREMFLLDPRVNRSHTFVYREHPFYDSHCLNKDIPAIISASKKAGYFPALLETVK